MSRASQGIVSGGAGRALRRVGGFGSISLWLALAAACSASSERPDAGPDATAVPDVDASPALADATSVELPDAGFPPCTTHADCPEPLACQYWNPGCDLQGECLRGQRRDPDAGYLPGPDAGHTPFGICSCDGRWLGNIYTDIAFQRRDFEGLEPCWPTDSGPAPEGCIPREQPNCDGAGCAGGCPAPYDGGVRQPCSQVLACTQSCAGSVGCQQSCFDAATVEAAALFGALGQCLWEECQTPNDAGIVPCPGDPGACAVCYAQKLEGSACPAERAACLAD